MREKVKVWKTSWHRFLSIEQLSTSLTLDNFYSIAKKRKRWKLRRSCYLARTRTHALLQHNSKKNKNNSNNSWETLSVDWCACVCLWQAEIFFHCQNRAAAKSQIKVSGSASQREREHSKLFTIVGIVCFLAPLLFVIVF